MSIQEYAVFKRDLEADAREDGFELTMPATAADFECGGIIGSVGLVDCVTECEGEVDCSWHNPGDFAFLLDNAEPLPFRPMKGKLHFFEVEEAD